MLPEQIVYIGVFLQLVGQASYVLSIYRGHAKPNLISWFIWMLAPFLGFFFMVSAGATFSALPVFMAGFGPFVIIISSILIKNGYWKVNTFDIYCGILALISLIFYILTRNISISLFFAILSDALAAIPTIIKTWKFPETESGLLYFFAIVSNVIGLMVIQEWAFSIYAFGLNVIIQCFIILLLIYRKKILFWYNA